MSEPVGGTGSVSNWILSLKRGNNEAAHELWERYFSQLCAIARRKLGQYPLRVSDEEDVAISVFDALCRGARAQRFRNLRDRTDLWKLLVVITSNKVTDKIRKETAQKRGSGMRGCAVENIVTRIPSPEDLLCLQDECEFLIRKLADDKLMTIARLKLEGHSKCDIACELNVSVRTIERKLDLIETIWLSTLDE